MDYGQTHSTNPIFGWQNSDFILSTTIFFGSDVNSCVWFCETFISFLLCYVLLCSHVVLIILLIYCKTQQSILKSTKPHIQIYLSGHYSCVQGLTRLVCHFDVVGWKYSCSCLWNAVDVGECCPGGSSCLIISRSWCSLLVAASDKICIFYTLYFQPTTS